MPFLVSQGQTYFGKKLGGAKTLQVLPYSVRRHGHARKRPAGRGLPALPIQLGWRAGVHARRNNTALNTAASSFSLVRQFRTPQKDLKPVLVNGVNCGQDGRTPICPKA